MCPELFVSFVGTFLSNQDADSTSSLDLLLGRSAEELGLDDRRLLWQMTLAKNFVVSSSDNIDDRSFVRLLRILEPRLFRDEGPQLVEIDRGAEVLLLSQMEVTHTDLSEVTRMVFVEVDSVMMLTAGITTTSGMLTVFANTTMSMADMTPQLAALLVLFSHLSDSKLQIGRAHV